MLLQLALVSFAVLWIGSPWQLSVGQAILSSLFFILIIFLSALPALFREWGNLKSALKIYIMIQILCLILSVLLPGIGQILSIMFNIYLMTRPVSFYKNIGFGFILFSVWFAGLNRILGIFLLEDQRGFLSGNSYILPIAWVILVIFLVAIVRAIYHAFINYKTVFLKPEAPAEKTNSGIIETHFNKTTQEDNSLLTKKEKKTGFPFFLVTVIAVIISLNIQPAWRIIAINDLNFAFNAIENNDYETASFYASKYYNENKILFSGDVFYLNALVSEVASQEDSSQNALEFYQKAAAWYDSHSSWTNKDFHGQTHFRLAILYINTDPPDYYRAKLAIDKALKIDPENMNFYNLHSEIIEHVSRFEEQEKIKFFRRLWNNMRVRF